MTDSSQDTRKIVDFPRRQDRLEVERPAPSSFEEALAAELDSLYGTALRLTRDEGLAEDLVQETALLAFRSFAALRSHDRFRPWLFTILHNAARNLARASSRRVQFVDIELETLLEDPLLAADMATPERILMGEGLSEEVEGALGGLPGPLLQALWLVDVEEFTIMETAGILGIPAGTVASRLHRARSAVRDRLEAGERGKPPKKEGSR